ncbi:hypothetical protein OPV22_007069 [Ensete ventricosum]|uniref:Uncharacterized protein n=1 Tax=Ensete ventricosum TaxID=4639 RepID=A0AAV8RR00_ENSVE|nr:hypothetical protein OPV22_007069 [Ensete ventricosum]
MAFDGGEGVAAVGVGRGYWLVKGPRSPMDTEKVGVFQGQTSIQYRIRCKARAVPSSSTTQPCTVASCLCILWF